MTDYITAPDVINALGAGTIDDVLLGIVITAASRHVADHCGRDFSPVASSVRDFYPVDPNVVRIDDATAVTVVATDDGSDGTYSTTWTTTEYQLQPVGGIGPAGQTGWPYTAIVAISSRTFTASPFNRRPPVRVTGAWGWTAIPEDVKLATLFLSTEMFKAAREAPFGSANMADFGPIQIRGNRRVRELLQPYQTIRAADGRFLVA